MLNNYPYQSADKYQLKTSTDENEKCLLKFIMCDDKKYQIHNLNQRELKDFISFAKKVEQLEWKNIRSDKGLHYEAISNLCPPSHISKDITLHSMRASQKFRIIGYKESKFFYIVWFDKNHESYNG